jgi:Cu/Ag efflux pump CusA
MAIAGVSQVIPIGGEVRQFQVQPDTRRMAELGIGLEQIEAACAVSPPTPRAASSNSTAAST